MSVSVFLCPQNVTVQTVCVFMGVSCTTIRSLFGVVHVCSPNRRPYYEDFLEIPLK